MRILVVLLGLTATAGAETRLRALAVPLFAAEGVSDDERASFSQRVDGRLRARGLALTEPARLTETETTCRDARCLARAGERLGVDLLVGGQVGKTGDDWFLTVWSYDRAKPEWLERREATCAGCSVDDARARLDALTDELLGRPLEHGRRSLYTGVAGAGVAVAALGLALLVVEAVRDGAPLCTGTLRSDGRCGQLRSTSTGQAVGGVILGAGVVAAIAGVLLVLRSPPASNESASEAHALWLAPSLSPSLAGLAAGGRW